MRLDKLSYKIFNTITKHRLIKPHDSIIVGVSGGPDSVALIKILHAINFAKNLKLSLFLAHLNHQLRGKSSEEDAQFVQKLSNELSLPFILKSVNIGEIAAQTKRSIEETARRERYNFFMESAQKNSASAVVTGHTADDNTETILHRIIRGTGTLGLGGIPLKRPLTTGSPIQLVRPLLFVWRKEIVEYLGEKHCKYRTDASNDELVYLRNKIRIELIPFLENQYNPKVKSLLIQLCQILNLQNEFLVTEAKKILQASTMEIKHDSYTIDTRCLTQYPKILQYFALREILNTLQIPLSEITYGHYTKILEEITRKGKGRHYQLPENLSLWHEHGMLRFQKDFLPARSAPTSETTIQIPGITPVHPLGHLVAEISDIQDFSLETYKQHKPRDQEVLDLYRIIMPLSVRMRKDGDTISPIGTRGHKKLKDLFIDKKIPVKERDAIPIIVMNNQPVCVFGICIDNKVKVTANTKKIVTLTFHRHDGNSIL
ncbi:MAG: tRNA lysidine(34) synthetase TilS [Candidatus Brocadia carolinensis]|uniref:tRNA(Ile)-lysidine synthase n=1 Tax=Candidatus Brocadia carolinensis TaxID=1004156 RepID=A0A1V4AS36_9BACT|nr:MAG: tRNA lysidine(34) synthetase TilS [Candidatus Brocadia caroliniensis]